MTPSAATPPPPENPAPAQPGAGATSFDADWNIQTVSEDVAGLFGYAPSELVGKNLHVLVPQGLDEVAGAPVPAGEEEREDWVLARRKDGTGFPLRLVTTAKAGVDLVLERSVALESTLASVSARFAPPSPSPAPSSSPASPKPDPGADSGPELERLRRELASALEQQAVLTLGLHAAGARAEALAGELAQARSARSTDEAWYQARIDELAPTLASARQEAAAAQAGRAETTAQAEARESRLVDVTRSLEAKAIEQATEDIGRELAAARVVLATLQHERDAWRARSEQAQEELATLAANLQRTERQATTAVQHGATLEQQIAEHRQAAAETRHALDAAAMALAERSQALEGARRELAEQLARAERMTGELQQSREDHLRARQQAHALESTLPEISRELAAARVILETLRQERDLWQSQCTGTRREQQTLSDQLTLSETRNQRLAEATTAVWASLRESLDLATHELIPVVGELRGTLARRAEAEDRLACARTDLERVTERGEALQSAVKQRLTLPLGEALDQLGLALNHHAAGWPPGPAPAPAPAPAPSPPPALESGDTTTVPAAALPSPEPPAGPPLSSTPARTA